MSKKIRAIGAIREHNIRMVLPDSSLCQNGKQVEIITKMIFELCYIEAIFAFYFPDAGRVAPIRACVSSSAKACVSSSAKHHQQTLPLMGATRLASEK